MKKNLLIKMVSVLALSTVLLTGCGSATTSSSSTSKVDQIKKAGKLVIGTSADYPPYEFHKSVDGKDTIVGFDISIAEQIAKDLGVKLEIKDMKFEGLLAALDAGNIDIVVASMTPTPERAKNVDFSKIYYKAVQSLVVRASDKDSYASLDAFNGKAVGVQKGSIQEELAKDQLSKSTAKSLGKITDLIAELSAKKVDGLIIEGPVAQAVAKQNSQIAISAAKFKADDDGSAVGVKKGNADLVKAIDSTIDRLNADKMIDKFVTDANALSDSN